MNMASRSIFYIYLFLDFIFRPMIAIISTLWFSERATREIRKSFKELSESNTFFILTVLSFGLYGIVYGAILLCYKLYYVQKKFSAPTRRSWKKACERAGIRNSNREHPQLLFCGRGYFVINANGIEISNFSGAGCYSSRRITDRLQASLDMTVTSASYWEAPKFLQFFGYGTSYSRIKIVAGHSFLPTMLPFERYIIDECPQEHIPMGFDGANYLYESLSSVIHIVTAGQTGSGKSSGIKLALCAIFLKSPRVRVYGIDFKQVELTIFKGVMEGIYDDERIFSIIRELFDEMMKRKEKYAKAECINFEEYREKIDKNEQRIVLVIDEYADFISFVRTKCPERPDPRMGRYITGSEEKLYSLARMARFAGICLWIATQRPSTDIINSNIREQLVTKQIYRLNSSITSVMILGSARAEELQNAGRMIYQGVKEEKELQSAFITQNQIKEIVEEVKKKRGVKTEGATEQETETTDSAASFAGQSKTEQKTEKSEDPKTETEKPKKDDNNITDIFSIIGDK